MRCIFGVVALTLMICPCQVDAQSPEGTVIMKISGVPAQFTVRVNQDDWTRIQSIQPASAPAVSGSNNPLTVRGTSSLVGRGGGGGSGPGSVGIQDMTITKVLDHSTPNLSGHCATGTHYPKVTLTVVRGDSQNEQGYFAYELENVTITSFNVSSGGSGENPPTEVMTVHFDEIKATSTRADTEYRVTPPTFTYNPGPR